MVVDSRGLSVYWASRALIHRSLLDGPWCQRQDFGVVRLAWVSGPCRWPGGRPVDCELWIRTVSGLRGSQWQPCCGRSELHLGVGVFAGLSCSGVGRGRGRRTALGDGAIWRHLERDRLDRPGGGRSDQTRCRVRQIFRNLFIRKPYLLVTTAPVPEIW